MKEIRNTLRSEFSKHGLDEYIFIFNNLFDDGDMPWTLDELCQISASEFRDLGVKKITHIKKIQSILNHLNSGIESKVAPNNKTPDSFNELNALIHPAFLEYLTETEPKSKLLDMCTVVELAYKLLAIYGLLILHNNNKIDNELKLYLSQRLKVPTVRSWVDISTILFNKYLKNKELQPIANYVKKLNNFLIVDVEQSSLDPQNSFLALRNSLAHGGINSVNALELLECWSKNFESIIINKSVLTKIHLALLSNKKFELLKVDSMEAQLKNPKKNNANLGLAFGDAPIRLKPFIVAEKVDLSSIKKTHDLKIYSRTLNKSIGFTSHFSSAFISDRSKAVVDFVHDLFDYKKEIKESLRYPDQSHKIIEQSKFIWGRDDEAIHIISELNSNEDFECLTVFGTAGSGKSSIFLKVADAALSKSLNNPSTLVIPYIFNATEVGESSRLDFLNYCNERIQSHFGIKDREIDSYLKDHYPDLTKSASNLFLALNKIIEENDIGLVKILIDGLDEVIKRDKYFIERTILISFNHSIRFRTLQWLVFSRKESSITPQLAKIKTKDIYPLLPKMSEQDMRLLILNEINIPPIQKKIIQLDQDTANSDQSKNLFISTVMKKADGYPLYVKYLINDLRSNKYPTLDINDLPNSLDQYHEQIIKELAIGDLALRLTPITVILALAKEPLSAEEIYSIYIDAYPRHSNRKTFNEALDHLSFLLTIDSDIENESGYKLHHQSLRDFLLNSSQLLLEIQTFKSVFSELSEQPEKYPATKNYFYRCGYKHLIEDQKLSQLKFNLSNFTYIRNMYVSFIPKTKSGEFNELSGRSPEHSTLDYFAQSAHNFTFSGEAYGSSGLSYTNIIVLIYEIWNEHLSDRKTKIYRLFTESIFPAWIQNDLKEGSNFDALLDIIRYHNLEKFNAELLQPKIFDYLIKALNLKEADHVFVLLLKANLCFNLGLYKQYVNTLNKINKIHSLRMDSKEHQLFIDDVIHLINGDHNKIHNINHKVSPKQIRGGTMPVDTTTLSGKYTNSSREISQKINDKDLKILFRRHISISNIFDRHLTSLRFIKNDKEATIYLNQVLNLYFKKLLLIKIIKLDSARASWTGSLFLKPIINAISWIPSESIHTISIIEILKKIEKYILVFNKKYPQYQYGVQVEMDDMTHLTLFDKFTRFSNRELSAYLYSATSRIRDIHNLNDTDYFFNNYYFKASEIRYKAKFDQKTYKSFIKNDEYWNAIKFNNYSSLSHRKAFKFSKLEGPEYYDYMQADFIQRLQLLIECNLYEYNSLNTKSEKLFKQFNHILSDRMNFLEQHISQNKPFFLAPYFSTDLMWGCRHFFYNAERIGSKKYIRISANLFKRIVEIGFKDSESLPIYFTKILDHAN